MPGSEVDPKNDRNPEGAGREVPPVEEAQPGGEKELGVFHVGLHGEYFGAVDLGTGEIVEGTQPEKADKSPDKAGE